MDLRLRTHSIPVFNVSSIYLVSFTYLYALSSNAAYSTDLRVGSEVDNCSTVPLLLSLPLSATSVAVRLAQAGRPGISREELGWGMD